MSNRFFIEPDRIKLFITEQDNVVWKNRKWSQHVSLYLNELIRRTFQEEESLPQEVSFALLTVTARLLQSPEELKQLQDDVLAWDPEAITIYLLKEPVSFHEKGYFVRLYTIDQESNLVLSEEEIFEKGKIQYFLSRISDVLYSIVGILSTHTGFVQDGIYLAESDESQEPLRQLIRKDLLRSGFYVFPDRNQEEDLLLEKLKSAILSVHFFGRNLETKRNILGELSSHFDNRTAVLAHKHRNDARRLQPSIKVLRRIIWIPESGVIKNEKQENFIAELKKTPALNEGAEFYWGSTEVLKEAILEVLKQQVTNRVTSTKNNVQLQQMVARKEPTMKYSDSTKMEQPRYEENPGHPESNAETHAQQDARHHNLMHWLRPEEEFRPTQNDKKQPEEKKEQGEAKPYVEEEFSSTQEEILISTEVLLLSEPETEAEITDLQESTETTNHTEEVTLNIASTEITSEKTSTE